jgi:amino acid adenylation domain-containing protein
MLLAPFIASAERFPGRTAFVEGERRLSYSEVLSLAQHVAGAIRSRHDHEDSVPAEPVAVTSSNRRNIRVAIALDRGIDAAAAILGALDAGAAYFPLDTKNPLQRLQFIVADAATTWVVGRGACPDWLPQPANWLNIEELLPSSPPSAREPGEQRQRREVFFDHQLMDAVNYGDHDIAAILYTSGSTGTPKGVALSHRAMGNFVYWALETFALGPQDRIASLAPFYFDLSVFDLFAGLAAGASIHFVPNALTLAPSKLSRWLAEQEISTWYTVPSLLSFLALKGGLHETPLPALKRILFAGEVFPTPQLISLSRQLPYVALYNLYGPTETNVCCYWSVDRQRLDPLQPIPIGISACASKLKIDADSGELLVASANNFAGYWRQGRLQPLTETWYRTGDKASYNERGELLYHGRLDRMLKCSGHRVEPAEIEAAIRAVPGVEQCAVIGIQDATSGQRPAAALVLQAGADVGEIAAAVRLNLPAYMQPCRYLQLDRLPCLSNGKIDYVGLTELFQ